MPLLWNSSRLRRCSTTSSSTEKAMGCSPASRSLPSRRTASTRGWAATGSTRSGCSPSRPRTTALTLPCPCPVAPSDPNSSHRTPATRPSRPSSRSRDAKVQAARIGPTACELDGPIPTLNRSKALMVTRTSLSLAGVLRPDRRLGTQLVYQMYCDGMSIPLKRQGPSATNLYDLAVSAEPLELDSSAVASLADKAYVAIRDRLIMPDLRPGDPIDDDELAKDSGVGRTPVREALKRLDGDWLAVRDPGRRAPRRAAERARRTADDERQDLASRIQHLDVTGIDRTELMRWELAVHRAMCRAAGNPHLEDVLIRYDNLATRIFCLFLDRLPTVDEHVGEHVDLLRAIAAGDAEQADDLAREHVLGFERAIRSVI